MLGSANMFFTCLQLVPKLAIRLGQDGFANTSARRKKEGALWRSDFFRDCLAAREVTLKTGAQVMLLKNLELGGRGANRMLVNGSRGVVVDMVSRDEFVNV